jgi:hypothetical protein
MTASATGADDDTAVRFTGSGCTAAIGKHHSNEITWRDSIAGVRVLAAAPEPTARLGWFELPAACLAGPLDGRQ